MSSMLARGICVSVGGRPILHVPDSARGYPTFLRWWLSKGKRHPESAMKWSSLSGPHVMHDRVELISESEWVSLNANDVDALREWIRHIPITMFYD